MKTILGAVAVILMLYGILALQVLLAP